MVLHDHPKPSASPCFEARQPPQPRDAMPPTREADLLQRVPQLDRPILFPCLPMQAAQHRQQPLIGFGTGTHRPVPPGVVAAAAHGEGRAESCHPMRARMLLDKAVSHPDSLAKYAAAFFKISRSSVTRASSRFSRAISAAGWACRPEPGKAPPCAATSFCHLYSRLRGTPNSRAISAAGRWPALSNCTACRLISGVNRRRWPMRHLLGGGIVPPFEVSVKPGLAHPDPFPILSSSFPSPDAGRGPRHSQRTSAQATPHLPV